MTKGQPAYWPAQPALLYNPDRTNFPWMVLPTADWDGPHQS